MRHRQYSSATLVLPLHLQCKSGLTIHAIGLDSLECNKYFIISVHLNSDNRGGLKRGLLCRLGQSFTAVPLL